MRSKKRANIVRVPTNELFGKYLELVAEGIESISLGQGRGACSCSILPNHNSASAPWEVLFPCLRWQ